MNEGLVTASSVLQEYRTYCLIVIFIVTGFAILNGVRATRNAIVLRKYRVEGFGDPELDELAKKVDPHWWLYALGWYSVSAWFLYVAYRLAQI
ncbi:hypothetical protein [Serratia ficaria]|uniref:hypothetical protein n=1 Tax=Serratia ficaria TaxID=61651 RepID=UPI0021C5A904|nr:hypothetical protein [Serratia ficaria]